MSNPIGRSSPQYAMMASQASGVSAAGTGSATGAAPTDAASAVAQAQQLQAKAQAAAKLATQVAQQTAALQQAAKQVAPNSPQAAAIAQQLQQASAQTDSFIQATEQQTLAALKAEQQANVLTVGAPAPFPLAALGAELARGLEKAHGVEAAKAFTQSLADMLATKPNATEEDVRQAGLGASLDAAQKKADELQKKQVPDEQTVDVNPASSDASIVDGWTRAAMGSVGTGSASKVKSFLEGERGTLTQLANLTSSIAGAKPFKHESDRLYAPALQALKAAFPSASVELVGVTQDAAKTKGNIMLRMAIPGKDNSEKSYAFTFHPEALNSEATKSKLEKELLSNPAAADAFNQALQKVAPGQAKGTLKESFAALNSLQGRTLIAQALLSLPPEAMTALLPSQGGKGQELLGGLLKMDKLAPEHAVLRVDGDALAAGASGKPLKTQISIAGAQDGSKQYNFLNQNAVTMFAPQFLQAMQVGTKTYPAAGVELDNAVGTAVGLKPSNTSPKPGEAAFTGKTAGYLKPITDQIRQVMKDAGVKDAKVTALPVIYNTSDTSSGGSSDGAGLALFRVDTGKGVKFVDQGGRVYKDMNDWRANNQLPPGRVSYPPNGELKLGSDGNPEIRTENTSATVDTLWKSIKEKGTTVAMDMGMFAAGVGMAGWATKLKPLAMLAERSKFIEGAFKFVRPATEAGAKQPLLVNAAGKAGMIAGPVFGYMSYKDIRDKAQHGQEWRPFVHPIQNSQVSGDWLMLASMGMGYAGMGRQMQLSRQAAKSGEAVAKGTINPAMMIMNGGVKDPKHIVEALNHGSFVAGTGLMADFWLQMAQQWGQMTPEQRSSQVKQNLFWSMTMPQQISEFRAQHAQAKALKGAAGVGVNPPSDAQPQS